MYFCYVDESGDCGMHDPAKPEQSGSPLFILTGVCVADNKWKISLETIKAFRKKIAREAYLNYDVEFHCSEMVDTHKVNAYQQISISDRWKIIEEYAETLGQNRALLLISVVINKTKSGLEPADYLTGAITALYIAFDELLKKEETYGIVFFDRANEKTTNTHVRKLLGTGASGMSGAARIGRIIEDPIFRLSHDSMFIQAADVAAYTLKEHELPKAARKKFYADRIFMKKLSGICLRSNAAGEDGIIRI